jgi:hypothetical protein
MADLSDEYMSDAESVFSEDDLFEMGDEENRPSPQKKTKGKAISMEVEDTSIIEVLGPNNNAKKAGSKGTGKQKTVEEMYQKKTQLEHILLRPDTYSKFSRIPGTPGAFVSRIVLERIAVSNILVSLSL